MSEPLNRPSLLAAIPLVLKHLKQEAKAGSGDLFGAATVEELHLPQLPDWDQDTKLWYERKALGAFVSGHPVIERRAKRPAGTFTHRCREEHDIYASRGARIVIGGLIRKYEPRGRIGFLSIEDETGALNLVIFSDEMERYASCLMDNAIVAVEVKPKVDFTRSSLQVTRVFRMGHFRNPER